VVDVRNRHAEWGHSASSRLRFACSQIHYQCGDAHTDTHTDLPVIHEEVLPRPR
jgi:hypothetical protein